VFLEVVFESLKVPLFRRWETCVNNSLVVSLFLQSMDLVLIFSHQESLENMTWRGVSGKTKTLETSMRISST